VDTQLLKKINLVSTMFVVIATVATLLHTSAFSTGLCLIACAYIPVVLIRDHILKLDLQSVKGTLFLFFQLALAFVIAIMSEDFFAQVYILILIGEFTFHHSRNQSILFTTLSYFCFVLSLRIFQHPPLYEKIFDFMPRVIEYYAIFGISFLAKIAFQQKNQLAKDNEQLRIASIELERKAKLQERTRIAREIHDSVGHTLTSAFAGLQTAAHAIQKNQYDIAQEMIDRTKENILSGLDDVRSSVHLLRENIPGHPFIPELTGLIEETNNQASVQITYEIDASMPELSPMIELTIYRALQEGLTNGIRHGASTKFHFSLTQHREHIEFMLTDNGKPPLQIVPGFGLNAMLERVKDVRGDLSISKNRPASGVTLAITIPLQVITNERSE
jgi:signal transduction histidine kinase